MKKGMVLGVALLAGVTGCGDLIQDALERHQGALEKGLVNVFARDLTSGILEIKGLAGGIESLAPGLETGGGFGLAPAMSAAPGLRPMFGELCLSAGSVTFPKNDYAAIADEKSAEITLKYTCDGNGGYIYYQVDAAIQYKDGGNGTLHVEELEYAGAATDGNVLDGWSHVVNTRNFPANDERESVVGELIVDFGGDFEKPTKPRKYAHYEHVVTMRNGTVVTAEVTPQTPLTDGQDMSQGEARRTITHAAGDVTMTTEVAVITGKDIGTFDGNRYYADGKADTMHVESDGTNISIAAAGRDGFEREGSVNLSSGAYEVTTTFPEPHVIDTVFEEGIWRRNAGNGTYHRIITFRDGETTELDVPSIRVVGNTLTAEFTHTDRDDTVITGRLTVVEAATQHQVTLEVYNVLGDSATVEMTYYPDGTSRQAYEKDFKDTTQNPDEEGTFTFAADGSGTGTVTVYDDAGGKSVYQVSVDATGKVTITDETGFVTVL